MQCQKPPSLYEYYDVCGADLGTSTLAFLAQTRRTSSCPDEAWPEPHQIPEEVSHWCADRAGTHRVNIVYRWQVWNCMQGSLRKPWDLRQLLCNGACKHCAVQRMLVHLDDTLKGRACSSATLACDMARCGRRWTRSSSVSTVIRCIYTFHRFDCLPDTCKVAGIVSTRGSGTMESGLQWPNSPMNTYEESIETTSWSYCNVQLSLSMKHDDTIQHISYHFIKDPSGFTRVYL